MLFIAIAVGGATLGITLLTPALPLIRGDLDASSDAVQLLITVYLVALALAQLVAGTVSDRYGRRPVLIVGAAFFTLGGGMAIFVDSIYLLTWCRMLQGVGAAACITGARTMVTDCYAREEAAGVMSTVQAVYALGPMLALAGGGLIAELAGWRGSMAVLAACGLIILVPAVLIVEETHWERTKRLDMTQVFAAYGNVLRNRMFIAFGLSGGMIVGGFFALNGFIPYQLERHGLTSVGIGLSFAITPLCYMIGNTLNRHYFAARGIERTATLGCIGNLVATSGLFLSHSLQVDHVLGLLIPLGLFGLANGTIVANTSVGAIHAAGKHAGTGSGLIGAFSMALGGAAGSLIIGLGGGENFALATLTLMSMASIALLASAYTWRQHGSRVSA